MNQNISAWMISGGETIDRPSDRELLHLLAVREAHRSAPTVASRLRAMFAAGRQAIAGHRDGESTSQLDCCPA